MKKGLPVLQYQFNPRGGFIRIVPIGCVHVGHKNFMEEKLKGFVKYIKETPDTYAVMMADTVENVLTETAARFPGSMYEQNLPLDEQREAAVELFRPIRHKILSWNEGNHSMRSWYQAGFSVEEWIAKQLDVPYVGLEGLIEVTVGKQKYSMHVTHGTGASANIQSIIGKLLVQSHRVANADIYLRSHHHQKVLADIFLFDGQTGEEKKKLLGATGCFMGYIGSYAHRKELRPVVPGCIKVKLYKERWDIHATL